MCACFFFISLVKVVVACISQVIAVRACCLSFLFQSEQTGGLRAFGASTGLVDRIGFRRSSR